MGFLKDVISHEENSFSKTIKENFNEYNKFCAENPDPKAIYYKYFKGSDSIMRKVDKLLFTNYPVKQKLISSRKKVFSVTSVGNVSIYNIAKKELEKNDTEEKKRIRFKNGCIFKEFNKEKFLKIAAIAVTMHLEHYEVSSLSAEHIFFIILHTMWTYFKVFDDKGNWIFDNNCLCEIYKKILNTKVETFEEAAKKYSMHLLRYTENEKALLSFSRRKPESSEDILQYINPDMTQTEKKEAIMKAFNCGSSKARQYMARFGLTNRKYERYDYAEIHAHLDDISEQVSEVSEQIDDSKAEVCNCIEEAKGDILDSIENLYRTMIDYKTGFVKN